MNFTPETFAELARRRSGDLAETPFPVLLQALHLHQRTAVVEVRRHQLSKKVVLELGIPIDARSNLVHETLGRFMVTLGKLEEETFNASLNESASRGIPLGEILVEKELVTPDELYRILQQNLAKKLLDLFSWKDGELRVAYDVPDLDSSLKVKVPQLILTGVTRFAPQEQVDRAIGPLVGKPLRLHPEPPVSLEELRLTASQARLVKALEGGRRLDELAAASGLAFGELTRVVYALAVLGLAVASEKPLKPARPARPPEPTAAPDGEASAPAAARAAPSPEGALAPEGPPGDAQAARNRLMETYLSYRRKDPFDLFGLTEESPLEAIHPAYLRFAERFAPWRYARGPLADLADKARDLFLAGARAYGQLAESESRNTLIVRRRTLRQEQSRGPHGHSGIQTDLLDPEVQFAKGQRLLEAGRLPEALQQLEFAADCDPQNGLYRAEVAHCRYRLAPTTGWRPALDELEEARRVDPHCGLALFYAAEIHRERGESERARALYEQAIKPMAPDRRPIEALKALGTKG